MPIASQNEINRFIEFLADIQLVPKPKYDTVNNISVCALFAQPINIKMTQQQGITDEIAYANCVGFILKKWRRMSECYRSSRISYLKDSFHLLKIPITLDKRNEDVEKHVVSLKIGESEPYSVTSDQHSVDSLRDQISKRFIKDVTDLLGENNMSPTLVERTLHKTKQKRWKYIQINIELPQKKAVLEKNPEEGPLRELYKSNRYLLIPLSNGLLKRDSSTAYILNVARKKPKIDSSLAIEED